MSTDLEAVPGPLPVPAEDRVRRLVAAWLLGFESPATRRNYALDMTAWLSFCGGHGIDPLAARRVHVDAWARTLHASGAAPRTVARRLAALSSWYRYLMAEGVRPGSPAEHVRRPKIADRGETPGLTRDELRRLLAAARQRGSARSLALLMLLAHTGLRINEALSRDVAHLAHDRGHRILRLERKGGRSDRTVLTAPVARALDDYLAGRTTGPLFITTTGRRMGQPEAWKMVRRLAARAALDGAGEIRPHSLRVAFITGAREAGVPLEDVQDAAGHADPAPPGAMTGAATPSTGTPPTRSRRGWQNHRPGQRWWHLAPPVASPLGGRQEIEGPDVTRAHDSEVPVIQRGDLGELQALGDSYHRRVDYAKRQAHVDLH